MTPTRTSDAPTARRLNGLDGGFRRAAGRFQRFSKRKHRVRNPWLKKNPFLSMWLSGANSVGGSIRGHAAAHARRQVNTALSEATKGNLKLWSDAVKAATAKPRTKRKR